MLALYHELAILSIFFCILDLLVAVGLWYNGAMNNAFLRKYVMKRAKDGDYLHSSGYARAQSGSNIGATGAKRADVVERKFVEGYDSSRVMRERKVGGERPKTYTPPANATKVDGPKPTLPPRRGI